MQEVEDHYVDFTEFTNNLQLCSGTHHVIRLDIMMAGELFSSLLESKCS